MLTLSSLHLLSHPPGSVFEHTEEKIEKGIGSLVYYSSLG